MDSQSPIITGDFHRKDSLFPGVDVSHWKAAKPDIEEWLNSLSNVVLSDPYWLGLGFQIEPSEVVQTILHSLPEEMPSLRLDGEAKSTFDQQFQRVMSDANILREVERGTSNSHPLKLQILAVPPNFSFLLHSHPTIEFMTPLVGALSEKYLDGVILNPSILARKLPLQDVQEEDKLYKSPSKSEIGQVKVALQSVMLERVKSLGNDGIFIDNTIEEGQAIFNAVGSIHQSYTKDRGCLLVCIWCGVHGDIDQSKCCCSGIEGSQDLFLP